MTKKWFSRLSLAALVGAAVGTTSCSDDNKAPLVPPEEPNKADVTVLYYSNGGGD